MIMNWNIINLIVKQQACRLLPPRTAIHSLACRETGAFISVWGDVRDLRRTRENIRCEESRRCSTELFSES